MNKGDLYRIWAPDESVWSAWAKPVLFASMIEKDFQVGDPFEPLDLSWLTLEKGMAIIIDLPGVDSVRAGLALAQQGFRPVPLYNSCIGFGMLVDIKPIVEALVGGASQLQTLRIHPGAPPAFMLDADRLDNSDKVEAGRFDNRWQAFPQDLPSAEFLAKQGIRSVFVLTYRMIYWDLNHILYRYQEAGIQIKTVNKWRKIEAAQISRPSQFRSFWYRWSVIMGLRRNSAGGFGALVPQMVYEDESKSFYDRQHGRPYRYYGGGMG